MLDTIRNLFSLLSPAMRLRWLCLVPFCLAEAALESAGAAAVYALIKILESPDTISGLPGFFTAAQGYAKPTVLLVFTGLAVCFFFLKNIFLLGFMYVRSAMTARTVTVLSGELLFRYLYAPLAFHFRRNSATLTDRLLRSVDDAVRKVLESAVALVSEMLVLCGMAAVLIAAAPVMTLASLSAAGLALGALLYGTQQLFYRLGERQQKLSVRSLETLQQAFGGIRELKAMNRERHWHGLFVANQTGIEKIRRLHATLNSAPRLLVETVFICIPLLVVIVLCLQPDSGRPVLPFLGLFAYAGFRAIPSCNRIAMHANNIRYGAVEADILYEDYSLFNNPGPGEEQYAPVSFEDRLAAEGISFSYTDEAGPVLRNVDFDIRRGQSVAIVGETGAGKSTLIDILLGLQQPASGRITVDGSDIRGREPAWRRAIGYVPQTIYLANDSLRRNIAFGISDQSIIEAKVLAAIRLAQLEDFAAGLPRGAATIIGERGATVSGGEKQRIAIARALYRDPELLMFDEATSALDSRTEQALAKAIQSLHGRVTIIVVAHRLQTIQSCDRIIFLHNATVAATGTFDELMGNKNFKKLMNGE